MKGSLLNTNGRHQHVLCFFSISRAWNFWANDSNKKDQEGEKQKRGLQNRETRCLNDESSVYQLPSAIF